MQALVRMADDAGYQFDLLRAVIEANEQQFARIVSSRTTCRRQSRRRKNLIAWPDLQSTYR